VLPTETLGTAIERSTLSESNNHRLFGNCGLCCVLGGFAEASRKLRGTMGTVLWCDQLLSCRHRKQHGSVQDSRNVEGFSMQADSPSAAQLARAQKLALLKLTAVMDRYSPSSKQGWNW